MKRGEWDPHLRGHDYVPYLLIHQVPSRGLSSRLPGYKTGRLHHLLSELETNFCLIQEFQRSTVDIREQFALPLDETLQIASDMGVRHPQESGRRGPPKRMTTDFVLTVRSAGTLKDLPRTCKYAKDLGNRRTLEKLEIEKRWWEIRGAEWRIVTEKDLPTNFVANARLLHPFLDARDLLIPQGQIAGRTRALWERIVAGDVTPAMVGLEEDHRSGTPEGSHLGLVYHAVAHRRWHVDLTQRIDALRPLPFLHVTEREVPSVQRLPSRWDLAAGRRRDTVQAPAPALGGAL